MVDHVRRERIDRIECLGLGAERLCANAHIEGKPADVVKLMHKKTAETLWVSAVLGSL